VQIRCPHCHQPIELVNDDPSGDMTCESCGSGFNLASDGQTVADDGSHAKSIAHFTLVDCLGQGAFGSVWKALDTELDRTVAVKIPRKESLSSTEAELFLREARSAAQLRHPNIVPVHEVGREDGTLYIVSDFIEGLSLADWLTGQQLTSREAVELCVTIAEALHYSHETGVTLASSLPGGLEEMAAQLDLFDVLEALEADWRDCVDWLEAQIPPNVKRRKRPPHKRWEESEDPETRQQIEKAVYSLPVLEVLDSHIQFAHPFQAALTWCEMRTGFEKEFIQSVFEPRPSNEPRDEARLSALMREIRSLNDGDWKVAEWARWYFERKRTTLPDDGAYVDWKWFLSWWPDYVEQDSPTSVDDVNSESATRKDECENNGTDTTDGQLPKNDDPESEPRLSDLHCRCLEMLRRSKATEKKPITQRQLASSIEGGADENYLKTPMGTLSNWGYVGGKRGRKGGNWITKKGRTQLATEKKAGWKME
jgi:hypothetical protein